MPYLLERLANRRKLPDGRDEPFDVVLAVAAQIQRIVSAHACGDKAGVLGATPFGMPYVVDVSATNVDQIQRYADALKNMIHLNEPRLTKVTVGMEKRSDPLTPYQLLVTGVLEPDGQEHTFHLAIPR